MSSSVSGSLGRLFVLCLIVSIAPTVRAQHLLYAHSGDAMRLVKRVVRNRPYVDDGTGKLIPAEQDRFALRPVSEYLPVFVSLRNVQVKTHATLLAGGNQINREFHFQTDLESPITLEDVFVVFDLSGEDIGHAIFIQEVGRLPAREVKFFSVAVPVTTDVGSGHYHIHVFSGGLEVFNSQISRPQIDAALAKMIARRIKGITDAPPQPLVGPAPEYPAKLLKKNIAGEARITCRISTHGEVQNPVVTSASDPAFGEAALVAARDWCFIPRVVGGQPVNSAAELPFKFSPESKPAAN